MRASIPAVLLVALVLPACLKVGPDYEGPPKVKHSGLFAGTRKSQKAPELDKWWKKLGSRELNGYVETALANNFDIGIATQRLREARAMRKQAVGALLPRAGANLSFTRLDIGGPIDNDLLGPISQAGFFSNPLDYWSTGLDVSWEIDVFGGRRREVRGAKAREEAQREALHGTRLAIAAEVVETGVLIAALREQQAEVKAQVALQEKQYSDMRDRVEAGAESQLDLDRSKARLEQTRAELPTLGAGVTAQLRRLALLIGERPDALDDRRVVTKSLPHKLPMIRTGIPAELVTRRPDLREAERKLAAATEGIGVAVSNFYPKFSIGGGPTSYGSNFGDLFNASNFIWQYGPSVEWSIFTGGANMAELDAANARQRAALLEYEKSVLAAIGEVETELANLRAETERLVIIQRARAATDSAVRRLRENEEAGAADLIEVLIEEERLRDAAIAEIRAKSQMLQVWVRLHKALGGGWE